MLDSAASFTRRREYAPLALTIMLRKRLTTTSHLLTPMARRLALPKMNTCSQQSTLTLLATTRLEEQILQREDIVTILTYLSEALADEGKTCRHWELILGFFFYFSIYVLIGFLSFSLFSCIDVPRH
jgi:hypothetical protein